MDIQRWAHARILLFAILFSALAPSAIALAQTADEPAPGGKPAEQTEQPPKQLADEQFDAAMSRGPQTEAAQPAGAVDKGLNLLYMASPQVGGVFMYPIYAFSFVVVLFGIERALALRRRRVIPRKLEAGVHELLEAPGGFDPRKAYRLCQQYPSTAASVLRSLLMQIGHPLADLENTIIKANEREAAKLYANIRPLNLSATVAPLLGLIGTVQGMIIAFYRTAYLPDGANKAQALAEGVYIALITTFAGLCVAIPAVCLSHFFEGKIQRLFARLDELVQSLLPALERYEGKLRVSRPGGALHHDGGPHVAGEAEIARKSAAASE